MLTMTMDLVYSNANGTVTATSVLSSAASWLMGGRMINGDAFTLNTNCALQDASGVCIGVRQTNQILFTLRRQFFA